MHQQINKLHTKLKIIFWIDLLIISGISIYLYLYNNIIPHSAENIIYERYAIILTLAAIPIALKFFHNQYKKIIDLSSDIFLKKYMNIYLLRLLIIDIPVLVAIGGYYIYGSPNFGYMLIILIFSKFFCFPSKPIIATDNDNDNTIDNNT